jgi:hypothetical protein
MAGMLGKDADLACVGRLELQLEPVEVDEPVVGW